MGKKIRKLCSIVSISLLLFTCKDGTRQKPHYVPANAEWIGGSDGGVWVLLNKTTPNDTLQFTIYLESGSFLETGKPWLISSFSGDCSFQHGKSLKDQIIAFDGTSLIMKKELPDGKNCTLKQSK